MVKRGPSAPRENPVAVIHALREGMIGHEVDRGDLLTMSRQKGAPRRR